MTVRWFRAKTVMVLVVALALLGAWQAGSGAWIYVKAQLAQVLLQRAWAGTLAGKQNTKPWPWADTWPVARLIVPSQGIDQIVLEGAYGRTLAFGPGHVESATGLGDHDAIILTGHRDTHFRFLEQLRREDEIVVQDRNGTWTRFSVQHHQVVDARTASILTDGVERQLVLVTCYPFDAIVPGGPLRYVVTASLRSAGPIHP